MHHPSTSLFPLSSEGLEHCKKVHSGILLFLLFLFATPSSSRPNGKRSSFFPAKIGTFESWAYVRVCPLSSRAQFQTGKFFLRIANWPFFVVRFSLHRRLAFNRAHVFFAFKERRRKPLGNGLLLAGFLRVSHGKIFFFAAHNAKCAFFNGGHS